MFLSVSIVQDKHRSMKSVPTSAILVVGLMFTAVVIPLNPFSLESKCLDAVSVIFAYPPVCVSGLSQDLKFWLCHANHTSEVQVI